MVKTYPISLVLEGAAVLVVGGGEVATRKVRGLLECGAQLTVVAPEVSLEIEQLASEARLQWSRRVYESSDLDDRTLVFACTNSKEVNARVSCDARARQVLVNAADMPDLCTFYLPSVLRRGMLSIAVSTEGSSPLTAKRIREDLEEHFGGEMEEYLELLQSWRRRVTSELSQDKRKIFWQRVTEGEVYALIQQGNSKEAEEYCAHLLKELSQ